MRKLIVLLSLIIIATGCKAQPKNDGTIAHYRILKTDSTFTTYTDLKKNEPVMLIYFGADCPHCQRLTLEMKQHMDVFKKLQIVMVTFSKTESPWMSMIRNFSRDYELPKYKNITMGTEYPDFLKYGYYPVQRYYAVQTTPYIAIYDRKGKVSKTFSKEPEIKDVVAAVKKVAP